MFTLIALGTGMAWLFSVAATAAPGIFPNAFRAADGSVAVYFEAAAVIVVLVLLGQVLELRARELTGGAIRALLDLADHPDADCAAAHALATAQIAEIDARLQRLHGRLAPPEPWELWLDGGHNEGAGRALAETLAGWRDRPLHLVVGMKQGKTAEGFLAPLLPLATTLTAIREAGQHLAMPVEEIIAASHGRAAAGPDLATALPRLLAGGPPGRILVCGSLYLAGEVLKADGTLPD